MIASIHYLHIIVRIYKLSSSTLTSWSCTNLLTTLSLKQISWLNKVSVSYTIKDHYMNPIQLYLRKYFLLIHNMYSFLNTSFLFIFTACYYLCSSFPNIINRNKLSLILNKFGVTYINLFMLFLSVHQHIY